MALHTVEKLLIYCFSMVPTTRQVTIKTNSFVNADDVVYESASIAYVNMELFAAVWFIDDHLSKQIN